MLRRMIGLGLTSFFSTEEMLRKVLGETVPRDWVEFAAAQSERTRRELLDRLATELGRSLRSVDLGELAAQLAHGHTLEVTARIRLVPNAPESDGHEPVRLRVAVEDEP
jgi:hypothetical protein